MPVSIVRALQGILILATIVTTGTATQGEEMKEISLPEPAVRGTISVEETIASRRSVRSYASEDLAIGEISQLLWAGQGITDKQRGFRAAPSAGALFPLELFLVKEDGVFRYIPEKHSLKSVSQKNVKKDMEHACWGQKFVGEAPCAIVLCVVYERLAGRYGERGVRYADIEVGHVAENIALQAVALGLSTVMVGAFDDKAVAEVLGLPDEVKPLYIIPVGHKKN